MQIILLEKVVNLGGLGDVVKVKDGYARNFLIPQGKAKRATRQPAEFEAKRVELERTRPKSCLPHRNWPASSKASASKCHAQGRHGRPPVRLGRQCRRRRGLKLPPHSIEAEQSLLGGLLLDNSAWDRIADQVSEADFLPRRPPPHLPPHRPPDRGRPPADVVTVFESLEKSAEAEQAGGMAYLGEIANNTPSAANIKRYAEIVRERAILRKLVAVGDEIAASALNPAGRRPSRCSTRPSRRSSRSRTPARAPRKASPPSSPCWARWWTASRSSTTASIPRTSPASRPASTTST
jgi:hypothetical protein